MPARVIQFSAPQPAALPVPTRAQTIERLLGSITSLNTNALTELAEIANRMALAGGSEERR